MTQAAASQAIKPNRPGRPSKLDPEVRDRLLKALTNGAPLRLACAAAGIGYQTLQEWILRGRGKHPTRRQTAEYAEFADLISKAIADSEMALLSKVRLAAEKNWKCATWLLSHRWPDRWADNHRVELIVEQRLGQEYESMFRRLEKALPGNVYEQVLEAIANDSEQTDEVTE